MPSKRLFAESKLRALPDDEQLTASQAYGVISQREYIERSGQSVVQITRNLEQRKHVERDDFVISMRSFQGGLERAWTSGCIRSSYVVLRPSKAVHVGFFAYLFKSDVYIKALQATSHFIRDGQDLNFGNFCLVDLPLPTLREQAAISQFLDRKTVAIDALISKKEKLVELLQEKRRALITEAVTKGLASGVPLKHSGTDWLGNIPAHWKVLPVRRLIAKIEQGWSPECDARPPEAGEWGVLKAGCTAHGSYRWRESKALLPGTEPVPKLLVRDGDVIMSRASGSPHIVGSCAIAASTPPLLMLSDKHFRLKLVTTIIDPSFFWLSIGARPSRVQIEVSISGAEGLANNLPQAELRKVVLAVPPLHEQADIARNVLAQTRKIEDTVTKLMQSAEALRVYRQALVTAAVTGKVDVMREA